MVYGTPLNSLGCWSNESIFLAVCTTFQSYLSHLDVVYFAVEVLIYGFDLGDKCTTYFEVWWWSRGVFVSLTHHLLERPLLAHMWRLFDSGRPCYNFTKEFHTDVSPSTGSSWYSIGLIDRTGRFTICKSIRFPHQTDKEKPFPSRASRGKKWNLLLQGA